MPLVTTSGYKKKKKMQIIPSKCDNILGNSNSEKVVIVDMCLPVSPEHNAKTKLAVVTPACMKREALVRSLKLFSLCSQ